MVGRVRRQVPRRVRGIDASRPTSRVGTTSANPSVLMVIIGVISMLRLPTAQFPEIAPPEVQVQATYVGADAQTIEQSVATPIEQQMSGVDNMNYMYSINAQQRRR